MPSLRLNSAYSLLGFALPTACMLAAYPLLVHRLGATEFGLYILGTSFGGIMAFLDFGFSAATLKFVAEDHARGDRIAAADVLMASLWFYAVLGTAGALIIWVLAPNLVGMFSVAPELRGQAVWVFRLAAIQFVASFVNSVFISLFKGLHRFLWSSVTLTLLSVLTYGGAVLAVVWGHAGLLGVMEVSVGANVFALLLAGALGLGLCRRLGIDLAAAKPRRATYKRLFGFGSAMLLSSLMGILHSQVQRVLVGALLGPSYVTSLFLGVWGPAKVNAGTLALSEPLFPKTAELIETSASNLKGLYRRYVGGVALLSFLALAPLLFFSRRVFQLWFHHAIPPEVPEIASVVSAGLFFNAVSQPAHHVINGTGKPWVNAASSVVSPLILYAFVALAYLLRGRLTLMDFAWGTSVSLGAGSILYLLWYDWLISRTILERRVAVSER